MVFTTTFYPKGISDWRAQCAVETALKALDLKIPVVNVDSGSPEEFLSILRNLNVTILSDETPGKPFGLCRRQALRFVEKQYPGAIAFWMEPEKSGMLDDIQLIVDPILKDDTDIVTPWRTQLFASYPFEQAHTETYGNFVFECATGCKWDVFAGPVAIAPKAAPVFLKYNQDGKRADLWDSTIIPRVEIAATMRGTSVEVDYRHPARQTQAEAGNPEFVKRRLTQLNNLCPQLWAEAEKWKLPRS